MTPQNETGSRRASVLWAVITPLLLAAAALSVVGTAFVPAIALLLDGRSRTWTGGVTVIAACAVAAPMLWPYGAAVCAFVGITTLAAMLLVRFKASFGTGLVIAAAGGVLGAVAALAVLGLGVGRPLNEAAGEGVAGVLKWMADNGNPLLLNSFTMSVKMIGQNGYTLEQLLVSLPREVMAMATADKIALVLPVFNELFAAYIPALALNAGMLAGGSAYWLPSRAFSRGGGAAGPYGAALPAAPPFFAFSVPRYAVFALVLLVFATPFFRGDGTGGGNALYVASNMVFNVLMVLQAVALLSHFLTKRKVRAGFQWLLLAPAVLLFSWLLFWLGFADTLLNIRVVAERMEALRARGKPVFSQSGLDELRKMDEEKRKNQGKGDGEDGKK